MAIYRGAGGASDSVDDATVNAVAAYAASAAASALDAAESAVEADAAASSTSGSVAAVATSASNAATSASNASISASNASVSASSAATSATSATASALAASVSAFESAASALGADTSEANAAASAASSSTYATNSANSAASALAIYGNTTAMNNAVSAAATSASNASTSASNAATSAITSTTQAANASDSAIAADSSELSALIYANNASISASNAATSAANAATSATASATSATNSAAVYGGLSAVNTAVATTTTNANNAATSASNAATSATQAAASAASASAIVLGVASSLPSIRPTLNLDFANSSVIDPRITFTRASTATYYDGKTTAKAEENLLTYSEQFDNAYWTKIGATATANTTTAPDGTVTADTLVEDTSLNNHRFASPAPLTASVPYSFSVYVKDINRQFVSLSVTGAGGNYFGATYDLTNVTIPSNRQLGTGYIYASSSITSVGNGWYRLVLSGTVGTTVSSTAHMISLSTNGTPTVDGRGIESYTGTGTSVYLWGAQLEQRSSVTAYTPTTTQAITNYIPVLQTAASGVARLDHDPVTFAAKGLLIEEARTNLLTYSSEFDNAAWTAISATVTVNTIIAPDGTLNGDAIVSTGTDSTGVFRSPSVSGAHALTVYAKQGTGRYLCLNSFFGSGPTYGAAWFDLQTGTAVGTPSSGVTQSITSVGNGWYRCGVTFIGPNRFTIIVTNSTSSFASAVGLSIYIWGAQLEAGAFATSYIPTTTAQATRAADNALLSTVSSWHNQAQGTLYAEYSIAALTTGGTPRIFTLLGLGGPSIDEIPLFVNQTTGSAGSFNAFRSSTNYGRLDTTPLFIGGTSTKLAATYSNNNRAVTARGIAPITSSTSFTIPTITSARLGSQDGIGSSCMNGYIKSIIYYPYAISNTELQALTA